MRKVLFFILSILISLVHAQAFATNVHGNTILTRYYFSDCYERDVDSLSNVTQRLYLGGSAYDATMMLEIDSAGSELHYLFRDYLGSVRLVTDRFGDVVQELSYDAWGRLRNPATHEVYAPGEEPELKIGRGYTSHEHLPWFGLINMNARLYDPVLGRFLSPDPFVQAPDLSQCFNRYSYAMNNPFRYTDESGEFWWLVIGAVIGGATNVIMKAVSGQLHSWGDGFAAFGIGAAAGLVGGAVSGWAFGVAGGAAAGAGGFYAGSLSGAAGSAISAPILSGGNSLYFGDPFMSASEYAYGVLGGALVGGTINGITASVNGKNFFTGRGKNSVEDIIAAYNQNLSHNHQQGCSELLSQKSYDISEKTINSFKKHFNSGNRHSDLNLSTNEMIENVINTIKQHQELFRQGDITMQGTVNGIEKTIKLYVNGKSITSINFYPGFSNRTNLKNPIIKYGDLIW